MNARAAHGGDFFHAVGEDFTHLERLHDVVSADVLDAWFDPSPRALAKLRAYLPDLLRTSPPLDAEGLVETITAQRGVPAECVLTGAGSSDLIFTALPALVETGSPALLPDPVYGEYPHVLQTLIGAQVHRYELDPASGFRMDTGAFLDSVNRTSPRFIAVVNPNSPTGRLWPKTDALEFLERLPSSTTLLVDETYIDYAGAENSLEQEVPKRSNLIVIKSMSKAYALSGLRVGYLIAPAAVIEKLRRLMPPWAISLLAQVAAVEALKDTDYYAERYRETCALRDHMARELALIADLRPVPSQTNFLLVEDTAGSVERIISGARKRNVFLRECSSISPRLANYFRIGIKTAKDNARILAAIRDSL